MSGLEFRDEKDAECGGIVLYDFEESTRLFESLIAAIAPKSVWKTGGLNGKGSHGHIWGQYGLILTDPS